MTQEDLQKELLQNSKYALLDLKGILEQFDLGGDHEHPAWKTVSELDEIIRKIDPQFDTVVDWSFVQKCDICDGEANFAQSPEGQLCGICDSWICNKCHDASAGLGKEPHPQVDVVCKICSKKV